MLFSVEDQTSSLVERTPIKCLRERTLSSPSSEPFPDGFSLVHVAFLRNSRRRYFLPTGKNYFGAFKSKYVMEDSGSNLHLIGIANETEFEVLLQSYGNELFTFSIHLARGISSKHVVLVVTHNFDVKFDIKLSQDLLGNSVTCQLQSLRFYLCSADMTRLLDNNCNILSAIQVKITLSA